MNEDYFRYTPSVLLFPLIFVGLIWGIFLLEEFHVVDLHFLAILPRTVEGLPGIFTSVFLHGSWSHLANNSVSLFVFLAALIYFYRDLSLKVVFYGILLSGAITWIIGRNSYHLGASGLIYVLFSFIFFKGIITKYYRLIALSLAVISSYGGMIWYVFPGVEEQISWEGHLGGFLTGLFFAFYYKTPPYKDMIRYDWQRTDYDPTEDKFMQRFDENGNFVNPPPPELLEEIEPEVANETSLETKVRVRYIYVSKVNTTTGLNDSHSPDVAESPQRN